MLGVMQVQISMVRPVQRILTLSADQADRTARVSSQNRLAAIAQTRIVERLVPQVFRAPAKSS